MPFRHARARLPDCISIIGQIHPDLHVRQHNEISDAKYSYETGLRDIAALVERGILVRNPEGGRSTSYSLAKVT